jgi:hypothetical protein
MNFDWLQNGMSTLLSPKYITKIFNDSSFSMMSTYTNGNLYLYSSTVYVATFFFFDENLCSNIIKMIGPPCIS